MKILLGCEESQAVTKEFRRLGLEAYSCDIVPTTGDNPEWHLQMDIFEAIKLKDWDMMIAFPPCTYLAVSGAGWLYNKDGTPNLDRHQKRSDALNFVSDLMKVNIRRIAIENPVGAISSFIRKPDQIIQPWMFGDSASKKTCLWLNNLPLLEPTKIVSKGEFFEWSDKKTGKLKRQPMWYYKALSEAKTSEERRTIRSKFFPGISKAMAEQWSKTLL